MARSSAHLSVRSSVLLGAVSSLYPLNVGRCRYFGEPPIPTPASTVVSTFRRPYGNPIVGAAAHQFKKSRWATSCSSCRASTGRTAMRLCLPKLAENPYMTATRAMGAEQGNDGRRKWNYFVLQLSFFTAGCCSAPVHPRHWAVSSGAVYAGHLRRVFMPPCAARHWPWA